MNNHTRAKLLVEKALPNITPEQSLALRSVAWLETRYGRAWKEPGKDSHNWGAITKQPEADGSCGKGFSYQDSRNENGGVVRYTTCFRAYDSDIDGIIHLYEVMMKPNVLDAIERKDLYGVSKAMRDNNYYLGVSDTYAKQVSNHARAMRAAHNTIVNQTGEASPFLSLGGLDSDGLPLWESELSYSLKPLSTLPVLKNGDSGIAVMLLQAALMGHMHYKPCDMPIDGRFGPKTMHGVRQFQESKHLTADYIVGPKTWEKLLL